MTRRSEADLYDSSSGACHFHETGHFDQRDEATSEHSDHTAQDTSWIHQRQVEERSSLHKVGAMADVLDSVWDEIIYTSD